MFTKNLIPTERRIQRDFAGDGIDRRRFPECIARGGAGLTFAQISDSRIGLAHAFRQPKPGTAPSPGPVTLPSRSSLAIVDTPLNAETAKAAASDFGQAGELIAQGGLL